MRNATIILYLKHRTNTKRDKIQFNHIRNLLNLSQWRNSRILIYQCTCTECLSKPPKKSITFWHFSTPAEECGSEIDINSSAILQHYYSSTPSQQRERERRNSLQLHQQFQKNLKNAELPKFSDINALYTILPKLPKEHHILSNKLATK